MNIHDKGTMPDGTAIQIENWHANYDFIAPNSMIAAYPISKYTHAGGFSPKAGEPYRFAFCFKTEADAERAFKALLAGKKTLKDYADRLDNPKYANCL